MPNITPFSKYEYEPFETYQRNPFINKKPTLNDALLSDTKNLAIQQNQLNILAGITIAVLSVGLFVLLRDK